MVPLRPRYESVRRNNEVREYDEMKTLAPIWQFDIRAQAATLKNEADDFVKQAIPVYRRLQVLDRKTQRFVLQHACKALKPFDRLRKTELALSLVKLDDRQLLRHWLIRQG